jgi:pyrimidine deaminase RibD-like protein
VIISAIQAAAGQQAEVGFFVEPVGCFIIAANGVVAVDTVKPALQHRAQEFQLRIADDHALHGLTLVIVLEVVAL